MAEIEDIELENHRLQMINDINILFEKYRKIFDWDVPDIDQQYADRIIGLQLRTAIDDFEKNLLH